MRWAIPDPLAARVAREGGAFVTGTGTGVGKTYLAALLAGDLAKRGLCMGVMKPAESGPGRDALKLIRASGCRAPLALVRPYHFKEALAPGLAGRVSLPRVMAAFKKLRSSHDALIVEGAGGLLAPFARGCSVADLAAKMGLPLLIVAKRGLGTLNHSLLTLEAARSRGLKVLGVVMSGGAVKGDASARGNPKALEKLGKVRVWVLEKGAKRLS